MTMEQKKIDRINELAKKSRTTGLTEAEKAEQQALRTEYVAAFRENLKRQLDDLTVVEPDGTRHRVRPKTPQS